MIDGAVIDAHALIWATTDQRRRIGSRALRLIQRAERGGATLHIPTVALVETAEAVWGGRLTLDGGFDDWLGRVFAKSHYRAADLTAAIVRRAHGLYAIPERGDRLIAATAAELDLPLITRDPAIAACAGVDLIW